MDAFELLKKDHQKVSQLFKQVESASGKSKTQLFTQLKSQLDLHAHVEEKFLYPALENKQESRDITLEAYEEHKVVKELLAELATAAPGDEWDAKLTVLKENVEHHVEEEEGELFDKAESVLSDEQIERLGADMEAEKARKQGVATESRATPKRAAATKNRGTRKQDSPGVLKRLANFVGLGDSSEGTAGKSSSKGKAANKKTAGTKKSASSTRKSARKSAPKAARKSAATTASKKSAATKSTKGRKSAPARKTTKKAGGGARKKAISRRK